MNYRSSSGLGRRYGTWKGRWRILQLVDPMRPGHLDSPGTAYQSKRAEDLQSRLDDARDRLSNIRAEAEEALESEISAVLVDEGFSSRIGLIFPPVDVALTSPPRVLVISPRDSIERKQTVLLESGMRVEDMDALEEKIFREQDLSALVTGIGGIATYPTMVRGELVPAPCHHHWGPRVASCLLVFPSPWLEYLQQQRDEHPQRDGSRSRRAGVGKQGLRVHNRTKAGDASSKHVAR